MGEPLERLNESLDAAAAIVTASAGGVEAGCLVGFHGQSSIDPLRWAVWISEANRTHRVITRAEIVVIHFLSLADRDLAELFGGTSGDDFDKFAMSDVSRRISGTPLLSRCPNVIIGRRHDVVSLDGDHTCVSIEPLAIRCSEPFSPLCYRDIADIYPGHPAS